MLESKYARKKRLQELGLHPKFGQLEETYETEEDIMENPKILSPINYFCEKFRIPVWINFGKNEGGNPGILIKIARKSTDERNRILGMRIIKKNGGSSYSIYKQNFEGGKEPLILSNNIRKLYDNPQIATSRSAQLELYAVEEAINKNIKQIESHLEVKLN